MSPMGLYWYIVAFNPGFSQKRKFEGADMISLSRYPCNDYFLERKTKDFFRGCSVIATGVFWSVFVPLLDSLIVGRNEGNVIMPPRFWRHPGKSFFCFLRESTVSEFVPSLALRPGGKFYAQQKKNSTIFPRHCQGCETAAVSLVFFQMSFSSHFFPGNASTARPLKNKKNLKTFMLACMTTRKRWK